MSKRRPGTKAKEEYEEGRAGGIAVGHALLAQPYEPAPGMSWLITGLSRPQQHRARWPIGTFDEVFEW